jgi:hypothetical protein
MGTLFLETITSSTSISETIMFLIVLFCISFMKRLWCTLFILKTLDCQCLIISRCYSES